MSKVHVGQLYIDKNGFIRGDYFGVLDVADFASIKAQTQPIAKELRAAGKPVLYLRDYTRAEGMTTPARKALGLNYQTMDYDGIAVFGASHLMEFMVLLISKAIPSRLADIRFFDTEKEAVDFLNNIKRTTIR